LYPEGIAGALYLDRMHIHLMRTINCGAIGYGVEGYLIAEFFVRGSRIRLE
jgi:hypothetical protein